MTLLRTTFRLKSKGSFGDPLRTRFLSTCRCSHIAGGVRARLILSPEVNVLAGRRDATIAPLPPLEGVVRLRAACGVHQVAHAHVRGHIEETPRFVSDCTLQGWLLACCASEDGVR
jgi:hypothetical protein